MDRGQDILSIFFLLLVVLVVSGLVYRYGYNNPVVIVPMFVLISVCFWIALDHILQTRYRKKEQCLIARYEKKNQIEGLEGEMQEETTEDPSLLLQLEEQIKKALDVEPKEPPKADFELEFHQKAQEPNIKGMHKEMACSADTALCNRMKYLALQPKMSQDIQAKFNKYTILPYFEEELREQENKIWWENDELENDMLPK
jgi:hypothetical protein